MAAIALTTANRVEVIESRDQKTLPAGVAITAGQAVRPDVTTGNWVLAQATTQANGNGVHIALRTAAAGEGLTAMRAGKLDGLAITGMSFNDSIFLSDTAGGLATTAGTVSIVLGRVVASNANPLGTTLDKTAQIACPL